MTYRVHMKHECTHIHSYYILPGSTHAYYIHDMTFMYVYIHDMCTYIHHIMIYEINIPVHMREINLPSKVHVSDS